ncbi:MAG: hypothetical protein JW821_18805, partial [Deltaproteobacteria bacterium]|nr:hypothetical protein [Deltaproteobacteria bacterium]
MTSENRRRFFRAQITAPARWQMLGEEERRLLDQGLGRALLDQVELPSPIDEFMEQAAPDSEEAHLFRSLQFINSKLDFMINQLFLK